MTEEFSLILQLQGSSVHCDARRALACNYHGEGQEGSSAVIGHCTARGQTFRERKIVASSGTQSEQQSNLHQELVVIEEIMTAAV